MLKVDPGRLDKQRRLRIDGQVPSKDPLWQQTDLHFEGPVEVALKAQQAGPDVLVRGTIQGEVLSNCRRCLGEVRVPVREEVSLLFRHGVDAFEAEDEEVYALPAHDRELDLGPAVREQILLAV